MSIINKEVYDFSVQAYVGDKFKTVTKSDILGKWSVFFFYPADFTFVCPTELEDLQNIYDKFQSVGCEIYSVSTDTHLFTRHGTIIPSVSASCSIPCWRIPPTPCARTSMC